MGCTRLDTDFLFFLEVETSKERARNQKKDLNVYPFGLEHKGYNDTPLAGQRDHKYGFGGKEEQNELGLDWIDITARNYDLALGRWMNIDPLAEKYYSDSPYAYVMNNPLSFNDPTGMSHNDVIINGPDSQLAFDELEKSVSSELTLSMSNSGGITYTNKKDSNGNNIALSAGAQQLVNAIDDNNLLISVYAENSDFIYETSRNTNERFNIGIVSGGAFMGNDVLGDFVLANQTVNPDFLSKYSAATGSPGRDMLHEVTEAFEGAMLSRQNGTGSPRGGQPNSVYLTAHSLAAPPSQGAVHNYYDLNNNFLPVRAINGVPQFTPAQEKVVAKRVTSVIDQSGNNVVLQTIK